MLKLKKLVHLSALLVGILVVPSLVLSGQFSDLDKGRMAELKNEIKIQKKAHKIHSKILTIDTHQDTPLIMSIYPSFFGEEFDLSQRYEIAEFSGFTFRQVDFPRMEEGGLDAAFFVAFISQGDRNDEGYQAAKEEVLGLISRVQA